MITCLEEYATNYNCPESTTTINTADIDIVDKSMRSLGMNTIKDFVCKILEA